MLGLPNVTFANLQSNLPATPSVTVPGTLITADATIHTKGAYSAGELIAATTYDTYGIFLFWTDTFTSNTATGQLLDVGIGPSGSEATIVNNLQTGWTDMNGLYLPMYIPKGERIAARLQSLISADTVGLTIFCYQGPSGPVGQMFSRCDAYGAVTADSSGLTHTPGASGSESTWTNIGTTTTMNYGAVFPMVQANADTSLTAQSQHWEIGINSVTLVEFMYRSLSNESWFGPYPSMPFYTSIPAGTQLMVRAESSGTAEATEVVVYCLG